MHPCVFCNRVSRILDDRPDRHIKMSLTRFAAIAGLLLSQSTAYAQDALKLAVGQRGVWENAISELGQDAGIFRKHGLALEILYTQGAGETQQVVVSGSADIGVGLGTYGVLGGFAKGAPLRVIGASMTGANDQFWYVRSDTAIRNVSELDGRSVAYSTAGSSTNVVVLALQRQFAHGLRPVATGSPSATFTQVMSGQIDVGWTTVPFGLEPLEQGRIRMIARASDIPQLRTQTVRVIVANAVALEHRKDVFARYLQACRETLDWMYRDPAALEAYAQWANIPERLARRVRDEFIARQDIDPDRISGLDEIMADAVAFRYLPAPLSPQQLHELIQIPAPTK